jgi:hypothetical protein
MRHGWVSVAIRLALVAALSVVIHQSRASLASDFAKLKLRKDLYALPSPEQAVIGSLGYRSAAADLLFAHVLVSCGIHIQEKRRFEFVENYLETINELDPKFRDPYRFTDTLLTLQAETPTVDDYRKARKILERGLRELPYDGELWVTAGQFAAYLAVGHLESDEEKREWRLTGARWLSRACELVSDSRNLPYHCITAAGLLSRAGEEAAMIEFVKKVLTMSDDPELRQVALRYLGSKLDQEDRAGVEARDRRFSAEASRDAPFISKELLLLIAPRISVLACTGRTEADDPACLSSWKAWGTLVAEATEATPNLDDSGE